MLLSNINSARWTRAVCHDTACHSVDDTQADPAAVRASMQFAQAIAYLQESRTARTYLGALTRPLIVLVDPNDDCLDTMGTSSAGHLIITWNPLRALMQTDGSGISPAVSLMHEIGHAVHFLRDAGLTRRLAAENDIMYDNAEERRTIDEVERPVARELNEGLRWNHVARGVPVDSVVLVGRGLDP